MVKQTNVCFFINLFFFIEIKGVRVRVRDSVWKSSLVLPEMIIFSISNANDTLD